MYIGVDTHKRSHVLMAIDEQGQACGSRKIANTPEGWAAALEWGKGWEHECIWGVENSGSLGKGLAQFLLEQGEGEVREIVPHRTAQYRKRGRTQDKTDTADALAMARLLRAESEYLPQVQADDVSTELRVLSEHRDNLVDDRTRLINRLHAQMLQIDPSYREKSGALTGDRGLSYCRSLSLPGANSLVQTRLLIVHQLADQLARLNEEIAEITKLLQERVCSTDTPLLELCGVGDVIAARLIGELGSTPRIHSAAALASLAGISPVEVSSGGRRGHRLNRGGNRKLNRAIHIIALSQRRCDPRAREYYARKRAEGKTQRAAMRCLKRRLVDVLYRLLRQGAMGVEAQKAA